MKNKYAPFRIIILVILGLLLGINIYLWNAKNILRDSLPMPFKYGVAVVLSGSMEPFLSVDDVILVKQNKKYGVGDVVVYQNANELIVHRIIEKHNDKIITQGDANNAADNPINISNIKGKVVYKISYLGMFVRFFKHPLGLIISFVILIFLAEKAYKKENEIKSEKLDEIRKEIELLKGK
ncbi:MAG: signal peptidase I [Bacilli bacterium]|nr:signal peptidase I [Bacilli bacterium]